MGRVPADSHPEKKKEMRSLKLFSLSPCDIMSLKTLRIQTAVLWLVIYRALLDIPSQLAASCH